MEWWIRMNIFMLDYDPTVCAQMHSDKHVVKMILESAQMICTTHHLHPAKHINYEIPYRKTHENHPCTKWVRESVSNYNWLLSLIRELNHEYRKRYNKNVNHKSYDAIRDLPTPDLPRNAGTIPALAMPDEYKIYPKNPDMCYKVYYAFGKTKLLNYTRSKQPAFIDEYQNDNLIKKTLLERGHDFNQ
jgi:hypothetical protein